MRKLPLFLALALCGLGPTVHAAALVAMVLPNECPVTKVGRTNDCTLNFRFKGEGQGVRNLSFSTASDGWTLTNVDCPTGSKALANNKHCDITLRFAPSDVLYYPDPQVRADYTDVNSGQAEHAFFSPRVTGKGTTYSWRSHGWGSCSAVCGGGKQTRKVNCAQDLDEVEVGEEQCYETIKPGKEQGCNPNACRHRWVVSDWQPCSTLCPTGAGQQRDVICQSEDDGLSYEDAACTDPRPTPIALTCAATGCIACEADASRGRYCVHLSLLPELR